ncbi:MAG: LysM peptidoglycan-binding domain-containing protein [Elusimicrobiota bacterium]|nr:LysM peptidoglycan-binding domain-containing protein [Elusimicrobiota bacterium]
MSKKSIIGVFLMGIVLAAGCAKKGEVPEADISGMEAERAIILAETEINEAGQLGADVEEASGILQNAKELFEQDNFNKAKFEADRARDMARALKEEILAFEREVSDAETAIKEAGQLIEELDSLGGDTGPSEEFLSDAEAAFDEENYTDAYNLAEKSIKISRERISALRKGTYIVGTWARDKDCLWNIAAKENIYNDPWKWKRIYKANSEKIDNPDLIYPDQKLVIPGK